MSYTKASGSKTWLWLSAPTISQQKWVCRLLRNTKQRNRSRMVFTSLSQEARGAIRYAWRAAEGSVECEILYDLVRSCLTVVSTRIANRSVKVGHYQLCYGTVYLQPFIYPSSFSISAHREWWLYQNVNTFCRLCCAQTQVSYPRPSSGMNTLIGYDLVPEPKILDAALRACRRLDDLASAIRILEAVKVL